MFETDFDVSYPDDPRRPGVKLHQQLHDRIGAALNTWVGYEPADFARSSEAEEEYWRHQAAMLDPDAAVWITGAGSVCGPVPAGTTWYIINSWGVLSSIYFTVSGSVTSGSPTFTAAALTGDPAAPNGNEAGLYVFGTGVAAGRRLLEVTAGGGSGRLSANATAPSTTPATYELFSTTYHRVLRSTMDEARPMAPGESAKISPIGGYIYVIKPELVLPPPFGTGTDQRYITDPKGLVHSRRAILRSLVARNWDLVVPPAAAVNAINTRAFPTDFENAMLVHVNAHDVSWIGLSQVDGSSVINTMNEISDYHMRRDTLKLLAPFKRSTFPALRVAGGSVLGSSQMLYGTGHGGGAQPETGQGGVSYVVLPEDW